MTMIGAAGPGAARLAQSIVRLTALGCACCGVVQLQSGVAPPEAGARAPAVVADAPSEAPTTVIVKSGRLELQALLWKPAGSGRFPAVLFAHGSGRGAGWRVPELGSRFVRHGYVFLFVYRRGSGLSADQGSTSEDLMQAELAAHGAEARNQLQVRLLETDHLEDTQAGLAYLRGRPDVDQHRLAIVGHSFGGALALLAAERDPAVRAVVDFSGGANSWPVRPACAPG